jgi:hypothetical protein
VARRAFKSLLGIAAIAAIAAASSGFVTASAQTVAGSQITPSGVGDVKLGASYRQLHRRGLVGRIKKGCELAPGTRSARLLPPLQGNVNFTLKDPRKVTDALIRGGASARGVGIGATIADIQAAYPSAIVDHETEKVFQITLVKIPKAGGGRIQFAVDVSSNKVSLIGVPFIAFCE